MDPRLPLALAKPTGKWLAKQGPYAVIIAFVMVTNAGAVFRLGWLIVRDERQQINTLRERMTQCELQRAEQEKTIQVLVNALVRSGTIPPPLSLLPEIKP